MPRNARSTNRGVHKNENRRLNSTLQEATQRCFVEHSVRCPHSAGTRAMQSRNQAQKKIVNADTGRRTAAVSAILQANSGGGSNGASGSRPAFSSDAGFKNPTSCPTGIVVRSGNGAGDRNINCTNFAIVNGEVMTTISEDWSLRLTSSAVGTLAAVESSSPPKKSGRVSSNHRKLM